MAKTETNVSTLKINRGTYAKVQENLSSITENELIITSDKNVPIPTTNDNGKAVVVNASGEYELGNAGMSQADADARYLKLAGGTMTGDLTIGANKAIRNNDGNIALYSSYGMTTIGNSYEAVSLNTSSNRDVKHNKGGTEYNVLDASNTSANPTLAGTETALTGLKVNGTSYAVPTPHTINTYTTGTLSEADQAKIANDIANGYPIIVGNNTYILTSSNQYRAYFMSDKTDHAFNGTYSNTDYVTLQYSFITHALNSSSSANIIPISAQSHNYSDTSGSLLTKITTDGQPRVFGAMSMYGNTTAPSSANTDGGYRLYIGSTDPATKYNGFIYVIHEP